MPAHIIVIHTLARLHSAARPSQSKLWNVNFNKHCSIVMIERHIYISLHSQYTWSLSYLLLNIYYITSFDYLMDGRAVGLGHFLRDSYKVKSERRNSSKYFSITFLRLSPLQFLHLFGPAECWGCACQSPSSSCNSVSQYMGRQSGYNVTPSHQGEEPRPCYHTAAQTQLC